MRVRSYTNTPKSIMKAEPAYKSLGVSLSASVGSNLTASSASLAASSSLPLKKIKFNR